MTTPGRNDLKKPDSRQYTAILSVFAICIFIHVFFIVLERKGMAPAMVVEDIWYRLFEFLSLIISFSIFLLTFYTYRHNPNKRLFISGLTFLIVGILDWILFFSWFGSPDLFLVSNISNNAVYYWLLSRFVNVAGFTLLETLTSPSGKSRRRGVYTLLTTVVVLAAILLISAFVDFSSTYQGTGLNTYAVILLICIALLYVYNFYEAIQNYNQTGDTLNKTLACAFVLMFFSQLILLDIQELYNVRILLSQVFKLAGFILFFNVFYIHGIRRPYTLLSSTKEELNSYAVKLDRLVDERTIILKQMNDRLMADIEIARGIQRAMLPNVFPQNDYVAFHSGYLPAENLSGDFYNVFKIDDDHMGVCIGDVSGHGVAAAMMTVFTFQKIQSLMEETGAEGMTIPSVVLKHLYDSFNAAHFNEDLYIVLLYGVYNINSGIFSFASGGLNTAPLRLRPDGSIQELDHDGYAILRLGEFLKPKFVNHQILLFPGDRLILYTDGLVEATDANNNAYSKARLKEVIKKHYKWSADHLTESILSDVQQFSSYQKDDVTMLIMDVLKPFYERLDAQ